MSKYIREHMHWPEEMLLTVGWRHVLNRNYLIFCHEFQWLVMGYFEKDSFSGVDTGEIYWLVMWQRLQCQGQGRPHPCAPNKYHRRRRRHPPPPHQDRPHICVSLQIPSTSSLCSSFSLSSWLIHDLIKMQFSFQTLNFNDHTSWFWDYRRTSLSFGQGDDNDD